MQQFGSDALAVSRDEQTNFGMNEVTVEEIRNNANG